MAARARTSPKNSRGFTLVEVLMAMLIMTVGLLGLLQSVNVAYEHSTRNKLREESILIGEENLSQLRLNPDLKLFTSVRRAIGGVDKSFTVTRESLPISDNANKLTVAVRWAFRNMTTKYEIYTIKSR